tara:strand:- start:198 stop:485 length:288 start_codon:yes stop_codon:yes gene_type:complete
MEIVKTKNVVKWPLGTLLPNDANVICHDDNFVLAGYRGEYVTWAWDSSRPDSTCWGHYFTNEQLGEAAEDFYSRCAATTIDINGAIRSRSLKNDD